MKEMDVVIMSATANPGSSNLGILTGIFVRVPVSLLRLILVIDFMGSLVQKIFPGRTHAPLNLDVIIIIAIAMGISISWGIVWVPESVISRRPGLGSSK